jgi:hypothetical protein
MEISLVRVSIRVLQIGLFSCTFGISSYISIFIFPSRYFFCYRSLLIFSFRSSYHLIHTALPNNTTLLSSNKNGLSPSMAPLSIGSTNFTIQLYITIRTLSSSFATTKEIQVCFFSCSY